MKMARKQINPRKSAFTALYDYQQDMSKAFPVDIKQLALQISKFEKDPIIDISAVEIDGFEAGLFFLKRQKAWVILYNKHIHRTRLNFTIAHEVGHYFLHRSIQDSFRCHISDIEFLNKRYIKQEQEADSFAAALLVPDSNFLEFITEKEISKKLFQDCCKKYDVSLTAILLKWIKMTSLEVVFLIEKGNKILWARSSDIAYSKGLFFKGNTKTIVAHNILEKHKYKKSIIFGTQYSKAKIKVFYKYSWH